MVYLYYDNQITSGQQFDTSNKKGLAWLANPKKCHVCRWSVLLFSNPTKSSLKMMKYLCLFQ